MQPAELTVENAEMSTSLGAGFWTGWAAGMAATLGAFAGAAYLFMHSGSPGGPTVAERRRGPPDRPPRASRTRTTNQHAAPPHRIPVLVFD